MDVLEAEQFTGGVTELKMKLFGSLPGVYLANSCLDCVSSIPKVELQLQNVGNKLVVNGNKLVVNGNKH